MARQLKRAVPRLGRRMWALNRWDFTPPVFFLRFFFFCLAEVWKFKSFAAADRFHFFCKNPRKSGFFLFFRAITAGRETSTQPTPKGIDLGQSGEFNKFNLQFPTLFPSGPNKRGPGTECFCVGQKEQVVPRWNGLPKDTKTVDIQHQLRMDGWMDG